MEFSLSFPLQKVLWKIIQTYGFHLEEHRGGCREKRIYSADGCFSFGGKTLLDVFFYHIIGYYEFNQIWYKDYAQYFSSFPNMKQQTTNMRQKLRQQSTKVLLQSNSMCSVKLFWSWWFIYDEDLAMFSNHKGLIESWHIFLLIDQIQLSLIFFIWKWMVSLVLPNQYLKRNGKDNLQHLFYRVWEKLQFFSEKIGIYHNLQSAIFWI